MVSWDHVVNLYQHIFTTESMATKIGRVVTYLEVLPPKESHGFWITNYNKYDCTATMSIVTKLIRVVTYLKGLLPIGSLYGSWVTSFTRSRDKLKALYLHYHIACGHQRWQHSDFYYNVTWSLNHVVLCGQLINKMCYICCWARPMDTNHCKVVKLLWGASTHRAT